MTDEGSRPADLVARIMAGDSKAEEELVREYSRGVMFLLRKHTGDSDLAQDLHQDTFHIVLVKIRNGKVRKPNSLNAFIRQVANNVMIEFYRKQRRRGEYADSEMIERIEEESRGPIAQLEVEEIQEGVRKVVEEMPVERDRKIIQRFYFDQASKHRICEELDLDPAHFDRVIYRAKQRLRKLLRGGEDDQ